MFFGSISCGGHEIKQPRELKKIEIQSEPVQTEESSFVLLKTVPHDTKAYTQGLIISDSFLYESTGHYGASSIRKIDIESGSILSKTPLPNLYFGEGITVLQDKIYMLTWQSRQCLIIDKQTLEIKDAFSYSGEGWGITDNGEMLIMSDGSNILKFIDVSSRKVVKMLSVTSMGKPLDRLNELEFVDGKIFANIYEEDKIAVINPESGNVEKILDFSELRKYEKDNALAEVMNGIAYDKVNDVFILTGKNWQNYYHIKIN